MDATTSDPLGDGCPMHQQCAIRSLLGRTSRDWWPNQLSLDILHQHGRSGNPLGDDFDYRKAFEALDYAGVKRSEEHTSELQSLMRISYAVFCLKKKTQTVILLSQHIRQTLMTNNN